MNFILSAIVFLFLPIAAAFEADFSGNLEGQFRHSENNDIAEAPPLFQDWKVSDFYLVYGNLNGKFTLNESKIEANWFVRYSQSELFKGPQAGPLKGIPYFSTNIFTFPSRLVARDVFQMQSVEQRNNHQTESILNKFYYEWNDGNRRFMIGRMYVNYGLGEIFNPINPFNQPTGLTSISQVAQGNDGFSYTYFLNDSHTLQFLILGDKNINNYNGNISKTLWLRGDIQANEKLQLDYVIGEDQNRYKVGGGLSYQFEESMVFFQSLYQSEKTNETHTTHLLDLMLGYDRQMTSKWHIRMESGYQKKDPSITDLTKLQRFLPSEYFVALANVYELHPLVKMSMTLINDIKSGFTYFIGKGSYSAGKNLELDHFINLPLATGQDPDNLAQQLVSLDFGIALRAFF